jgi:hypothetical protein
VENLLDEDELVEITGENFTPRKRRATKAREHLDDRFLRRSKRNDMKLDGFKFAPAQADMEEILEPMPLAMTPAPGCTPAPHLPKNIIEGIVTGFLQIQPTVVSAALLQDDPDEAQD